MIYRKDLRKGRNLKEKKDEELNRMEEGMKQRKDIRHHHYLDFANFIGLKLWSAVMVDEADATR